MEGADEQAHHGSIKKRDCSGGNGVRIEDLQQLDIRSDDRNQVAFVPALQLCGAEFPQCEENLIPDQRKQLKRDKMVAGLLCIAQDRPECGKRQHTDKYGFRLEGHVKTQQDKRRISAQDRDEGRAQMPCQSHKNRQRHKSGKRLHKADKPYHDRKSAPSFHTAAPSFPSARPSVPAEWPS